MPVRCGDVCPIGGGASGRALAERVAELMPLAYKGDEIADFGEVLTLAMSSTAAHNHRAAATLYDSNPSMTFSPSTTRVSGGRALRRPNHSSNV